MTNELIVDKDKTALVVIDLQKGIATNPDLRPHSSQEVIANAARLVDAFHRTICQCSWSTSLPLRKRP